MDDVKALVEVLAQRRPIGRQSGVGAWALLRQYERRRKLGASPVNAVCDGLQLLFAHPSELARWARNTGLSGVDRLGFLKQWVMARATHLEPGA
jgi:2-polyprenyl-6-methoxyphenol hydroxylase-like FAD-dependent oxidoreductase